MTPLLLFVRHGPDRGDTVARLLRAGADPDRKDPGGEAPLHIAIRTGGNRGKVDVAEAWLAGGADPCVRDAQGFIPYSAAAEGGPIHQALDRAGGYGRACDGRGEAVALDSDQRRRIQAALAAAGFDPGPADGKFGPKTRRAIEAWQEAAGYAATGDLTGEQVEAILTGTTPVAAALEPKCADRPAGTWTIVTLHVGRSSRTALDDIGGMATTIPTGRRDGPDDAREESRTDAERFPYPQVASTVPMKAPSRCLTARGMATG